MLFGGVFEGFWREVYLEVIVFVDEDLFICLYWWFLGVLRGFDFDGVLLLLIKCEFGWRVFFFGDIFCIIVLKFNE